MNEQEMKEKYDHMLEQAYALYQKKDNEEKLSMDEFAEDFFENHDYMEDLLPEEMHDDYDDIWKWLIWGELPE